MWASIFNSYQLRKKNISQNISVYCVKKCEIVVLRLRRLSDRNAVFITAVSVSLFSKAIFVFRYIAAQLLVIQLHGPRLHPFHL